MEAKKQAQNPCPSPSSSAFKTPRPPLRSFNFQSSPRFFTPCNVTPASSARGRHAAKSSATAAKSKAARKLRAFEQEQSKSSRKALTDKEKSLKSLAKSLGVWLNFLFENPRSCGCDVSRFAGGFEDLGECEAGAALTGKRESRPACGVGDGEPWRDPKRQRNMSWRGLGKEETWAFPDSMFSRLKISLLEVCSFDDLKERMKNYLSLGSCSEIFTAMTQVAKNIDEGRLKMKAHCPMVTDVGMKEKALKTLMCYNPTWLRIGLYIILGGDSLLQNEDSNSEQEVAFLRMLIEKQFFSHAGFAKTYAYNKLVEGLYRPGYYEELGKVILKRFLLLVLVLDRAKCQSSLPCKYGIDGLDGGSRLLFSLQSHVKSSNQLINEFLSSDVMHGEGNLLAHLVIMGFKATYQQNPLVEYQFKVVDIFEDLHDGVRLCRAVQLLQHDPSILMKMLVPSDTRKKCLNNCGAVLQYLEQAGVPITDEDGTTIIDEDVVNGDKELILSLLWNMFVHLQLPLLINKALMAEEIRKIQGFEGKYTNSRTHLDMLLCWIQAICESYDLKVDAFSSLVDGKAMWCLLDFYFRKELHHSCSFKAPDEAEVSIVTAIDYTDAVHNFILSQKLPSLLGNFPEVLQVSDILESNGVCNDRSVVILLAFLSFQLLVRRNMEHLNFHKLLGFNCQSPERRRLSKDQWFMNPAADMKQVERIHTSEEAAKSFKVIMSWWKDMAIRNNKCDLEQVPETKQELFTCKGGSSRERENAAKLIQRAWIIYKSQMLSLQTRHSAALQIQRHWHGWLMRKAFINKKQSATLIQSAFRSMKCSRDFKCYSCEVKSAIILQAYVRGWIARRDYNRCKYLIVSIQSHCRGCIKRKELSLQKEAAIRIQTAARWMIHHNIFLSQKHAATEIQRLVRGEITRQRLLGSSRYRRTSSSTFIVSELRIFLQSVTKLQRLWRAVLLHRQRERSAVVIQSHIRGWIARKQASRKRHEIIVIQSHCRGCIKRKELLDQKEAAVRIQTAARWMIYHNTFLSQKHAATEIQRLVRGEITRKRLLGSSRYRRTSSNTFIVSELRIFLQSVTKLQRLWRAALLHRQRERSAIVIQSYIRGWIARKQASRKRHEIIVIQSYTKAYLVRKDLKGKLLDLRLRVKKSAANIDDGMRIINRLLAALSELLNMKSVSGILNTCATLDMATKHSQRCCEELVAAGAVEILVKQVQAVSRSIPDQEVLKLALSTLRNLTRYPHLIQVLITTRDCIDAIFMEFLRNKEEGYFIAAELLKKVFLHHNGIEAVHNLPALVKRLHNHVEELSRKAKNDKRTTQAVAMREKVDRRLREAVEILELIKSSNSN